MFAQHTALDLWSSEYSIRINYFDAKIALPNDG